MCNKHFITLVVYYGETFHSCTLYFHSLLLVSCSIHVIVILSLGTAVFNSCSSSLSSKKMAPRFLAGDLLQVSDATVRISSV